ncbi:hypothetical protein ACHAXR_011958 [Thalassiosira sp. AJA248-18]
MFDGSHRTNKREINLAGASASSRSSRKTHLNVARQQRVARALAKAKLNGAKCLQRSWRGSRVRKIIAAELDDQFQAVIHDLSHNLCNPDTTADHRQQKISEAASLLAFRMSPTLLPFYACRHVDGAAESLGKKKWSAADEVAEKCLRQNLLSLENVLQSFSNQQIIVPIISPIASRKIVSITLILLRQFIHFQNDNSNKEVGIQKHEEENKCLVALVNYVLECSFSSSSSGGCEVLTRDSSLWTKRPSDTYMDILRTKESSTAPAAGWMINLFLCFRDFMSFNDNRGEVSAMDVDCSNGTGDNVEERLLLKWCCRVILHLATMNQKQQQQRQQMTSSMHPLMYQQVLALLASIIFTSFSVGDSPEWVNELLTGCIVKLEQSTRDQMSDSDESSLSWRPLLIHFLSISMDAMSDFPSNCNASMKFGQKVPGVMPDFSPYYSPPQKSVSDDDGCSLRNPWMEALRGTLSSRESIVMSQVVSHANACQKQTQHQKELLTYAIPIILQYTLQHQHELAILTNFSAQGENISSWFTQQNANGLQATGSTGVTSIANAAAAAAYDREDITEDSDDDDDDQDAPAQQQQQQRPARDTSTGRYSRADLQTLPKLDALYQARTIRAKKSTVDRLRSLLPKYGEQVRLLVSLAEKIGKGEWIQQLGNALFSSTPSLPSSSSSPLLAPLSLSSWQRQAQVAYTSALATVMITCSGIKAGRNAASPLLARLAFHDAFLHGLWERSSRNVSLLLTQSKSPDLSELAPAYELFSSFCDTFSHHLLAVNDDDFLDRYHNTTDPNVRIIVKDVVLALKKLLNDLYWIRPVLASDIAITQNDPESNLRFQRARLLLSGTKLWNSLYERWCRLYRAVQFCTEDCWWFPYLASRGRHDNNPIIQSQVTTLTDQGNDAMGDDSSVESANMDDGEDEAAPMSANDAGGDALASTFRDPKMARVLTYIPQAMPFSRRVTLFNSLLESDKIRTQDESASFRQMMMNFEEGEESGEISGRERVTIRRDALYSDSKQRLNRLGKRLRKKVQVTFVNKHGQEEAGIDGGGVFKEFLDDLIKDGFLPETVRESGEEEDEVMETHPDFFSVTPLQTLKVNTSSDGNDAILSHYEFLGRVLGKSIYESILVEPQFCLPFLNKLLGKQNSLDDLKNLDPEYYKNLKSLRHMRAQEINNLGLTFELHDSTTDTIELMPGGSTMPVTKENVIQYIHLVSHQKMNVRGSRQTSAFLHGFRDIIPAQWVRLFSAYELQKLISGDDAVKGIDVQGMMSVMRYSGGLHPSQPIVQWLWQTVDEMTPEQQRKFLKFMTSCSRQPLLGFGSMVPAPCIQQTRLREDDHGNDVAEALGTGNIRLPTSSTCMNLLKLPKYTSKEMLRGKLLYAIEAAAGFELS